MLTIVPNWHPVAVHFSIGLLSTAVLLLLVSRVLGATSQGLALGQVGQWNLFLGTIAALWSVLTGWLAYNSVVHDAISHQAMTIHLRWAIPTAVLFVSLSVWLWLKRKAHAPGLISLIVLLIGLGALGRTGYLGAENVYRFGLGVQSTPAMRALVESGVDAEINSPEDESANQGHDDEHAGSHTH